nr:hypothetical protein [uncultured Albidiferax sp.]
MSAKMISRDFALGKVKKLRRMKQPISLVVALDQPPRNHVARALAQRATSGAAGKHIRSQGAERRAQKMALGKLLQEKY